MKRALLAFALAVRREKMRPLLLLVLIFAIGFVKAAEPNRSKGLSAHFLPKRVTEANPSKEFSKWGFITTIAESANRPVKERPTFQSVSALIAYYKQLDNETQRNGIWIVITNPHAYSSEENTMMEELKLQCKIQHIPLFIGRGRDLPDGWQRYSYLQVTRTLNSA